MKLTVIGTGYVGLVSGACLAEIGNNVTCVDIDERKIELLKDGVIPIYEPGLEDIVRRNFAAERIQFTTDITQAIDDNDLVMIAVGTPQDEDGSADLQYVLNVASTIGKSMTTDKVVVVKSTVPVGTSKKIKTTIQSELDKRGEKLKFEMVSNPEFLKEGAAVTDFMRPDRIIVGCAGWFAPAPAIEPTYRYS